MAGKSGEQNSQAKLTEDEVLAIRKDTRPLKEVAYDYGVTPAHVWRIRKRKKWTYLDDEKQP